MILDRFERAGVDDPAVSCDERRLDDVVIAIGVDAAVAHELAASPNGRAGAQLAAGLKDAPIFFTVYTALIVLGAAVMVGSRSVPKLPTWGK